MHLRDSPTNPRRSGIGVRKAYEKQFLLQTLGELLTWNGMERGGLHDVKSVNELHFTKHGLKQHATE